MRRRRRQQPHTRSNDHTTTLNHTHRHTTDHGHAHMMYTQTHLCQTCCKCKNSAKTGSVHFNKTTNGVPNKQFVQLCLDRYPRRTPDIAERVVKWTRIKRIITRQQTRTLTCNTPNTNIHTHTHTYIHTYIHAYINTHTHSPLQGKNERQVAGHTNQTTFPIHDRATTELLAPINRHTAHTTVSHAPDTPTTDRRHPHPTCQH